MASHCTEASLANHCGGTCEVVGTIVYIDRMKELIDSLSAA